MEVHYNDIFIRNQSKIEGSDIYLLLAAFYQA